MSLIPNKKPGPYCFSFYKNNELFSFDLSEIKSKKLFHKKAKKAFCLFTSAEKSMQFLSNLEGPILAKNLNHHSFEGFSFEHSFLPEETKITGTDYFFDLVSKQSGHYKKLVLIDPSFQISDDLIELEVEDMIYSTHRDPFTGHLMTSDPKLAMALLALKPSDLEMLGINISFHIISNSEAPEQFPERQFWLEEQVKNLQQTMAKLYVPYGKNRCHLVCVILNLENPIEEKFFIRRYQTLELLGSNLKAVFVTSDLHLYSDQLKSIPYNGKEVEGILIPLMNWYFNEGTKSSLEENHFSF